MIEIVLEYQKILEVDADTLEGADFAKANLHRAILDGMNLRGASFRGADMRNASLIGADASNADMSHACLVGVDFRGGVAVGTHFCSAQLSGIDLDNADLTGAKLVGAHIGSAFVRNLKLCRANLTATHWYDIDFVGVDLTGCTLGAASFRDCRNMDRAIGLETIRFTSPCAADILTIRNGLAAANDVFLRGIGMEELQRLRSSDRRKNGRPAKGSVGYLSTRNIAGVDMLESGLSRRLKLVRERRDLTAFLSRLELATTAGFVEAGELAFSTHELWALITPYSAVPTDRLPDHATPLRQSQWIVESWQAAGFGDSCYISFGGAMPWMKLVLKEGERSLCELWEKSESKEFVLLSGDQTKMLAFTEEEYEYYAYIVDLSSPARSKTR